MERLNKNKEKKISYELLKKEIPAVRKYEIIVNIRLNLFVEKLSAVN